MNWRAKWIWVAGRRDTPNCYIYARREFDLEHVADAQLSIACSSEYRVYINGRYVGRGAAHCGRSYHPFDLYDVKSFLRPGHNVIGVMCHNRGVDSAYGPAKRGGLLAQLDLVNGEAPILATDSDWRVSLARELDSTSPRINDMSGFQEVYDSRLKPVGWNVVGFDDSAWLEPEALGEASADPWGVLIHRTIPSLIETEILPASVVTCGRVDNPSPVRYPRSLLSASGEYATISPGGDRAIVLDFGREIVGFPELSVLDGGTTAVDIGYSIVLAEDGRMCTVGDGVAQADRVILHGGRQEWQSFGRRTFRYIQLTFRDVGSPILVGRAAVSGIGYPARQAWDFECSDQTLNLVYSAGVSALSLCMQDTYERDPLHDQSSYPSDARLQALANYYTFADTALAASDLRRFARDLAGEDSCQLLDWVLMLHDYYLYSGDKSVVEDVYPRVKSGLLETDSTPDGVLGPLYYQALRDASKLALAMESFDDAKAWHERSQTVKASFDGCFQGENESMDTGLMAVACGLVSTHHADHVKNDIARRAPDLPNAMLFHTLQAMAKLDLTDEALELIRGKYGADNGPTPSPAWATAVAAGFLASEVLGIKPYFAHPLSVTIQPRLGGLEWARGGFTLPAMQLQVEWKRNEDEFSLEIDASSGCVVAIPVSGFRSPVIHEIDLTPETPERRARKTYGWGDVIWRAGGERDPYLDWLDAQDSEPPKHYQPKSRCDIGGGYVWVREMVSNHVRYVVHEQ